MADIKELYGQEHARLSDSPHMYPTEWVVRTMLGRYPGLKMEPVDWAAANILDLGFGDGRNFPLLHNLHANIFGVEISSAICQAAASRAARRGISCELKVGSNAAIPFAAASMDHVLACHSCYYIEDGLAFGNNIREIARVLKDHGFFIFSLPTVDSFILKDSTSLGGNYFRICKDPYGLRNGTIMRAFAAQQEIAEALNPHFSVIGCGRCTDDWYGIFQDTWIVVAQRLCR